MAALYGALRIYGPGCLVVDFCTAVTVDSLSFDGVHRGGGIFPGPDLILKSLNTGTSGVRAEGWSLLPRLGTTTRECVLSAITYALSGMVRGYLGELAPLPKLILTGGGCREWLPLPRRVYDHSWFSKAWSSMEENGSDGLDLYLYEVAMAFLEMTGRGASLSWSWPWWSPGGNGKFHGRPGKSLSEGGVGRGGPPLWSP